MIWIFAFRVFNSLIVRGYFSPDEYWQSLEVAHKLVFGYGDLTWEWDDKSLRSIIHPGIFALLYYILSVFKLDYPWLIAYSPRLLQGCFLAISDIFIYKSSGKTALFLSLTSWFLFYAGVRTFSNSIELTLNSIAFYLYSKNRITQWNFIVGLACMIRPTAIIIWIPYYICELSKGLHRFLLKTISIV
jgi:phosphatidylinositol glycan class B